MFRSRSLRLLGLGFMVGIFAITTTPAQACMTPNCSELCYPCPCIANNTLCWPCLGEEIVSPAGPQSYLTFLEGNRVRLMVQGYETTQLEPQTSCITAFPPLDSVASVDSVVNFDGRTNEPFAEVEFHLSEGPEGLTVADLAQAEGVSSRNSSWFTFRSHITGSVEDGVSNYFVIELTLKEGVDPFDFVEELKTEGSFLTSGSDEDGIPNHHTSFRQLGSGSIIIGLSDLPTPASPPFPWPNQGPLDF